MRIIFVYAGFPSDPRIQAPYSITKNVYEYLSSKTEVVYYPWDKIGTIETNENDIILGHPHYDDQTIIQRLFRSAKTCRARCLIHPLHTNRVNDNIPFTPLASVADKIFSITGKYWYDTLESTCFASWKPKIIRLDMAINMEHYPFIKKSFNPPNERSLVYIGSAMPQKNLSFMREIMLALPNTKLIWYGGHRDEPLSKLPNVETHGWAVLTKEVAENICSRGDIFINTSISDANPTTLLEATSWGLVAACTKESGYYGGEMFYELELGDLRKSIDIIKYLLNVDETVLLERSAYNRKIVAQEHTWEKFNTTIWNELQKLCS